MNIEDFYEKLNKNLNDQLVSSRVLLDKLRIIEEESRNSSQYQDPFYFPFYYHLGKYLNPKSILQIGLNLGLQACCFLQSNTSVDKFLGFQKERNEYYSDRIAISNLKDVSKSHIDFYKGKIFDKKFVEKLENNFDLIFINDEESEEDLKNILNICWNYLNLDGVIVLDNIEKNKKMNQIFENFCKSKNRKDFYFKTRYGVGIVQK